MGLNSIVNSNHSALDRLCGCAPNSWIIAALPFSIVLVLTFFSLMKAFKEEGSLKKEKKSV
ncbi:hypothetical protein [Priestia aryabhattai]|uniref:hypothetical protein n=1 Tax=Priestia aryabhattai TaxID=412384 RepID=UPI0027E24A5D|nr:hypothetical protein [Priestia aryabhattai]